MSPAGVPLLAGTRQPGESARAVQACNDWLRLGPNRSLPVLARLTDTDRGSPTSPTLGTLKQWSARFAWAERATAYDQAAEAQTQAELAAGQAAAAEARRQILATGYASDLARIRALNRLARALEREIYEKDAAGRRHKRWLRDVKQIGSGEFAEKVELERFNGALIEHFRGALDDLAKETGGRVQKLAPTTPDGQAPYRPGLTLDDLADLTDAELATLVAADRPRAPAGGLGGTR